MYLFKNKHIALYALILRVFGLLIGISAITLQLFTNSIIGKGFMANHVLAYFTIQTNIFSTLIFLYLIIKTIIVSVKNRKLEIVNTNPSIHLACTFYITITMLVYWCLLSFMVGVGNKPIEICNTLFLHLFTPLISIIDCILFYKHGKLKKIDALKWLTYPCLYLISIVIIANVSEEAYYKFPFKGNLISLHYPYPFIDPQVVGIGGFILVAILLFISVYLFALLYIYIDNKIALFIENRKTIEK